MKTLLNSANFTKAASAVRNKESHTDRLPKAAGLQILRKFSENSSKGLKNLSGYCY